MASMSRSPATSLALRNRRIARPGHGHLVTSEVTLPAHHTWNGQLQYSDQQPQSIGHNVASSQLGWLETYDDTTLTSSAGLDKNDAGFMFNGHLDGIDICFLPEHGSWYLDPDGQNLHAVGNLQNDSSASFPVVSGGWYGPAVAYTSLAAASTYQSDNVTIPTSNYYASMPVSAPKLDFLPANVSEILVERKSPFSTISSSLSEDALPPSFPDIDHSPISVPVDRSMPSVGSKFDFQGVGSFGVYENIPAVKIETDSHDRLMSLQTKKSGLHTEMSNSSVEHGPRGSKVSAKKRNATPAGKEAVLVNNTTASFSDCVTVFETVPGAISQTKRRRKLSPSSHESFKVTRKIGACLECRFRKRPCAPGTPCPYCIKIFGPYDIAEVNCHRESPFVGYNVTDYFLVTSDKRIIDFNLKLPEYESNTALMAAQRYVMIDGRSGPCSLPTQLPVREQLFSDLSLEARTEIWRTKKQSPASDGSQLDLPTYVIVPAEDDETLGKRLEDWAIQYAAKFSKYHSARYPTAYAFNVGMCYIAKQLPENVLVKQLLKGTALAYVLRAGLKIVPDPNAHFSLLQAKIDTILYRRLRAAESLQFAMLQKIVWVSAGRLKQQQLYPVAYVIWQTMRSICLRASHLANLQCRFKGRGNTTFAMEVDHLGHCFNLLLATHTALFRSNSPILLDFTKESNAALLGQDEELVGEAMRLRKVILNFQEFSLSRPFRSSNWYRDSMYRRFRSILHGKGFRLGEEERKDRAKWPGEKGRGVEEGEGRVIEVTEGKEVKVKVNKGKRQREGKDMVMETEKGIGDRSWMGNGNGIGKEQVKLESGEQDKPVLAVL